MSADSGRRRRLAQLVVAQRAVRVRRRTLSVRVAAVVGWALVAGWAVVGGTGDPWRWGLPLVPALVALALEARRATTGGGNAPLLGTAWLLGALLLLVPPAWTDPALPFLLRSGAVAAADVLVVSVASGLFLQPTWFDPSARAHPALEWLRRAAGPLTALVTVAVLVPGRWPTTTMPAVWAMALVPAFVGARIYGVDHLVASVVPLIREEGQRGRDQVLREIHGALSTELRQLQRRAWDHRDLAPELYERAVSANSSLRETLTLTDEERDTSTTTDTLVASVRTLTRAEGASASMRIEVPQLDAADRDLVRLVLHELVDAALRAGAPLLDIVVGETAGPRRSIGPGADRPASRSSAARRLNVTVTTALVPGSVGVRLWSPLLEQKLATREGWVRAAAAAGGGTAVAASWESSA